MDLNLTFGQHLVVTMVMTVVFMLMLPEYYLPFIALARARHWTLRYTLTLTVVSGICHILSAMLLAALFMLFSERLTELHKEWFESVCGWMAAWMLTILGVAYALWGIRYARQHDDGTVHTHEHTDLSAHAHPHEVGRSPLLAWSLFIFFALMPSEWLLPTLVSAATFGRTCLFLSAILFSATTLATMLLTVTVGYYGLRALVFPHAERWVHLVAGAVLAFWGFEMILKSIIKSIIR